MAAKTYAGARKIPPLRHHKSTNQAYIRVDGIFHYLGRWGLSETQQIYERTIAEWLLGKSKLQASPDEITILEVVDRYLTFASTYYRDSDGRINREYSNITVSLRVLNRLYGQMRAVEFGPLALKAVREQMIGLGWCRRQVNHQVGRIRRMIRWATENELVPGTVYHALQSVTGLKRGRCAAKDNPPVRPAPQPLVEAVQPFVSRQVWAMVRIQRLTGARGGEICIMRPCDIDRSEEVWVYRPTDHKTAYTGHERSIYIGPCAQEILSPFLLRPAEQYCFSPMEAQQDRLRERAKARKTPLSCGNRPGTNRKAKPRKQPSDRYTSGSLARAIDYALARAFPLPGEIAKQPHESAKEWKVRLTPEQTQQLSEWKRQHHWHPHQLRHNAATELRKEFGLEAAKIILGHQSVGITEIYAEQDKEKAIKAIAKCG